MRNIKYFSIRIQLQLISLHVLGAVNLELASDYLNLPKKYIL